MKRKRLTILLASALVIGVMLGAVVATLLLSNSQTFNLTVTADYQMVWSQPDPYTQWSECKPPNPIFRETWYNDTGKMIEANLTNYDINHGYDVTINISFYCDGEMVKKGMVKAAALYKIEGLQWKDVLNINNPTWSGSGPNLFMKDDGSSGPYPFAYALMTGIHLDANAGTGRNWVQFRIRFWLGPSTWAPTGAWHIELSATGIQNP